MEKHGSDTESRRRGGSSYFRETSFHLMERRFL